MSDQEITCSVIPEDSQGTYDLVFKVIVIGDSGVGKSCLTLKAIKNQFEEYYTATVGFEFFTLNIQANEDKLKMQIWDTCGQEIYRSLISSFYKNATLAMIVYSIDNRESFEHLHFWLNEVKYQSSPDVKIFLIGNKKDLEAEGQRKVTEEEAQAFVQENGIDFFMETSAKTGINASELFLKAAKVLYKNHLFFKESGNHPKASEDNILPTPPNKKNLTDKVIKTETKSGCC